MSRCRWVGSCLLSMSCRWIPSLRSLCFLWEQEMTSPGRSTGVGWVPSLDFCCRVDGEQQGTVVCPLWVYVQIFCTTWLNKLDTKVNLAADSLHLEVRLRSNEEKKNKSNNSSFSIKTKTHLRDLEQGTFAYFMREMKISFFRLNMTGL